MFNEKLVGNPTLSCIFFIKMYSNETNKCMILKLIQIFTFSKFITSKQFTKKFQKMLLKVPYFEQIKINILSSKGGFNSI